MMATSRVHPAALLRRFLVLALVALLAGTGPLAARPLSDAETRALAETVSRFDEAMKARDFAVVSQTIPPKVMAFIADNAKITVAELQQVLVAQMKQTMEAATIVSFGMDLGKAESRSLPDGSPYLLIPTQTVIDQGGGDRVAVRSHTLALLDGTRWYLLRVSDPAQVQILKQVYPGFAAETFPAGTTEPVK